MEINEKIQLIRNSFNMNKKQFSEALGVSQPTITRYEEGTRSPDYDFLKKLFINHHINPSWIFFDMEPLFVDTDDYQISNFNLDAIKEIGMFLSAEEFNRRLNAIISEQIIDIIASDSTQEKSPIRKFLEATKLEGHIPFRPLLFLYYIFRYVRDNAGELAEITSFQAYLLDLVKRYNVVSFKNNPAFTSRIKKEFEASISENLTENDCKRLLTNYEVVINTIEKKMNSAIVTAHKKIDTKTLFPKKR